MEPTSEERRKVAERLRSVTDDELRYVFIEEILNHAVGGCCFNYEGETDKRLILNRLADLIDPTCHVVGTISYDWSNGSTVYSHELSCGHTRETSLPEPPAFCDECGARVVSE